MAGKSGVESREAMATEAALMFTQVTKKARARGKLNDAELATVRAMSSGLGRYTSELSSAIKREAIELAWARLGKKNGNGKNGKNGHSA